MHIHSPFTGGFESVFDCWFTNLSWHIGGFVTLAKFQNAQVADKIKSSPEPTQVSHMPVISPARAANVATYAWLSFMMKSWTGFLAFECHLGKQCMTGSIWSDLNHCAYLYRLWAACRWWSVDAQTRSCYACFNFSCLCSGWPTLHSGSSTQ